MRVNANGIRPACDAVSVAMFKAQDLIAESRDIADFATVRAAQGFIKALNEAEHGLTSHAASLPGFFQIS